jgi:predicted DNA-binding transcriptional regulator YafY
MRETICTAIENLQILDFTYERLPRSVEPHKVGKTTAGNVVLSGYQVGGRSHSNSVPYWRLYKLSKIADLSITDEHFDGARPRYKPTDQRMTQIYCRL